MLLGWMLLHGMVTSSTTHRTIGDPIPIPIPISSLEDISLFFLSTVSFLLSKSIRIICFCRCRLFFYSRCVIEICEVRWFLGGEKEEEEKELRLLMNGPGRANCLLAEAASPSPQGGKERERPEGKG